MGISDDVKWVGDLMGERQGGDVESGRVHGRNSNYYCEKNVLDGISTLKETANGGKVNSHFPRKMFSIIALFIIYDEDGGSSHLPAVSRDREIRRN